jgi:hypothetical protein
VRYIIKNREDMKLSKKIMLFEDFNTNQQAADKSQSSSIQIGQTEVTSNRIDIVKDVDSIINRLVDLANNLNSTKQLDPFEKINNQQVISETYEIVKDYMTYDEVSDLIHEGFFNFIKDLFNNPIQKRKLDKLGQDLLKTKIELMKIEIEEDSIDSLKTQLAVMKRGDANYQTASGKIEIADRAKATKVKSLQDRESAIIDQMDLIGSESEKLQKYVDRVKLEIRIKANDATIRISDGETERILRDLKKQDLITVKDINKQLDI